MFQWIAENALTVIVFAAVLTVAVLSLVLGKRGKKSCCTGDCTACDTGCNKKRIIEIRRKFRRSYTEHRSGSDPGAVFFDIFVKM